MAKKKRKKISDIKNALLSNTSFIQNTEQEKSEEVKLDHRQNLPDNLVEIDKSTLSRIKILANYYGKNYEDLIGEALIHYLRIKKLDIEDALKNIVVGADEDE